MMQQHMDVSPTSDVGDSLQMVLGTQSFRDEVQTMIVQQMKVDRVNTSVPYAARGSVSLVTLAIAAVKCQTEQLTPMINLLICIIGIVG